MVHQVCQVRSSVIHQGPPVLVSKIQNIAELLPSIPRSHSQDYRQKEKKRLLRWVRVPVLNGPDFATKSGLVDHKREPVNGIEVFVQQQTCFLWAGHCIIKDRSDRLPPKGLGARRSLSFGDISTWDCGRCPSQYWSALSTQLVDLIDAMDVSHRIAGCVNVYVLSELYP